MVLVASSMVHHYCRYWLGELYEGDSEEEDDVVVVVDDDATEMRGWEPEAGELRGRCVAMFVLAVTAGRGGRGAGCRDVARYREDVWR